MTYTVTLGAPPARASAPASFVVDMDTWLADLVTEWSGFAAYLANNSTIVGGALDATTIGLSTPTAAAFTSITGTAVQSNLKDATPGKLMKVGAFGWGVDDASLDSSPGDDLDALTIQGVWRYSSGTTGAPSTAGNVIHLTRLSGSYMQVAVSNTGVMYLRSYTSSVWSSWTETAQQGDSVSFADITGTGLLTLGGNAIGGEELTIADDAVGIFTPPRNGGYALITCHGNTSSPSNSFSAVLFFDVGLSLLIEKSTGFTSANTDVSTSDVTGTTGTNGNVTYAVQSGVLKIENRSGVSKNFQVTWL